MTLVVKLGKSNEIEVSVILTPAGHQNERVYSSRNRSLVVGAVCRIAVESVLVLIAHMVKVSESEYVKLSVIEYPVISLFSVDIGGQPIAVPSV